MQAFGGFMGAGRPTTYDPSMIQKARDYVKNYAQYGDVVPMVVGLCRVLNRGQSTLYQWAKEDGKEEFADTLKEIEEAQHQALVNKGLSGEFNAPITKIMMAKHGYSEKQEIEQTNTNYNVSVTKDEAKSISQALDDDC